jgi:hypothetical protein
VMYQVGNGRWGLFPRAKSHGDKKVSGKISKIEVSLSVLKRAPREARYELRTAVNAELRSVYRNE